ncbi:Xaa-Pro peptidase family protein [Actinomadura viridis]|uniref:Xaa-Pro aminopeptidase n=1 Tax=Actinomadura viridis TaxID=58110 RepID=A0A931DJB2_9ACTN|nr:Xaa-Pro peptidase family protein [Actinomadura viridis]MBG6091060.1 Xaa-Pro aminopeptidase [Actinomadura viridis]
MPVQTPFDRERLDALCEAHGVDAVVATTKHNVQYLMGGYRYFFFANMDAIGLSRYLPALAYVRGRADSAFYIGAGNEAWGTDVSDVWVPEIRNVSWSSVETAHAVAEGLTRRGLARGTVAVEAGFIPADAMDALRAELPEAVFVEAQTLLEELRAVKSPDELTLVRRASELIIDAMLATFDTARPGETKSAIAQRFRREQVARGLDFDYALVTAGPGLNRAPTDREIWRPGATLSLDSGGMYRGYIGDLARMGVAAAEPTALQSDLLAEVEAVQQAARVPVRAGGRGGDIFDAAHKAMAGCPHAEEMFFVAHGMGLITHEAPRLTATGPVPYPADHADLPLRTGMVLSIETWIENGEVGFVKLEDTLIVTDDGWEAPGDIGRGYQVPSGHADGAS